MTENIIPHSHSITQMDRIKKLGYKPFLIWFVGMSGSGKSTLASALEEKLFADGRNTYILDGDNIRSGLNKDLDFSDESRKENIRRIAEVSKLFVDAGTVVLTAFITPFAEEREKIKQLVGSDNYLEVFVDCPLEECEKRDVKGLYAKARRGEIKNFTGIDSPFEKPINADVVVESHKVSIAEGVEAIYKIVKEKINIHE
ncbi:MULTISPECIES: adenylyl-sulfate kinase [Reichenbachiella]|uniref:adenylyl-sulfate kinase n=1 Tax=Reichenbachiella TaxID=156993 RepID=UPI000E6B866A|nr:MULTISPECIES: adenylyl-sulfate kinase [Reichenbachiella]MBU2916055.1 adenylyl-sulfate kinase [Reichenbachiella agariperforans]RJE71701.1 adenylyl-sulfate kinase [Reichenbachiella sp. MSK19-1]